MDFLNEHFDKELQRMSKLAGIPRNSVNEGVKTDTNPNIVHEVLNEQDDLFGDLTDVFSQQTNAIQKKPSTGKLSKDLKAAMVLNNVSEYQAALHGLNTKYNPKTLGAKPEELGGTAGTIIAKKPIEKFKDASKDIENMKYSNSNHLKDLTSNDFDKEIENQKKFSSAPVSWDEKSKQFNPTNQISLAKWQPTHKDESIISYEKQVDKFGHETFSLSDRGKEQLEFLQRMYSNKPLPPNGDESVDIESVLTNNDFIYKNVVTANSEKILRDFFNKAVVPIIASALKRTTAAPKDTQFERFVRAGVDHALDQTKRGKYNPSFKNYGAWFIQVVKHKVIDQLKSQTTFRLDTAHAYDLLSNMPGPLKIDSQLNPEQAIGNYDSVIESKNKFTKDGVEHNYFTYVYQKPENALSDLEAKALKTDTGFKKSPLKAQYLKEPGMFYKSSLEHIPANTSQQTVEPAYFEKFEDISANTVLKIASKEVNDILAQIAKEIVVSNAKVGDTVKLSGRENALYPTLTKGQSYEVIEKGEDPTVGGGKPKKYYYVIDDSGKKIKVGARALTPTESVEGKIVSKARENEQTVTELLRLLLQYGRLKPVYTKTVYLPKADGGWAKKNVGDAVAKDRTGKIIVPFSTDKAGSKYKDLESAPIEYVWSTEKYSDEVNDKIIDDIANMAKKKGLNLPSQYFTATNEPLYKQKGVPKDTKQKTIEFINGVRNALRRYFGFTSLNNEVIKQNRDILKKLIDNWSNSQEAIAQNITEVEIRKTIKGLLKEINEIETLDAISVDAQKWVSKKVAQLIGTTEL